LLGAAPAVPVETASPSVSFRHPTLRKGPRCRKMTNLRPAFAAAVITSPLPPALNLYGDASSGGPL
jgi:hypothetical protein